MTRSRRTCVSGGMSPISSRKIDPPSATSNKQFLHDVRAPHDRPAIDFAAHCLSQRSALFFFAPSLHSGSDSRADVLVLKRFADATKGAFFPGGNRSIERGVGGDHNDYSFRI